MAVRSEPERGQATAGQQQGRRSTGDAAFRSHLRLKAIAWQIPEGPGRDQAIRIGATAERIIAVMAADRRDAATVTWFDSQLLEPTLSLLDHYARLSRPGVAAAETLRRVEEENLPRLKSRFDTLYDHLHRGEIVDLAVASEMLDFDLPEPPPAGTHDRA